MTLSTFIEWQESEDYAEWLDETAEKILADKGVYDLFCLRSEAHGAPHLTVNLRLCGVLDDFLNQEGIYDLAKAITLDKFAPDIDQDRTDGATTDFLRDLKTFVVDRLEKEGHAERAFMNMCIDEEEDRAVSAYEKRMHA